VVNSITSNVKIPQLKFLTIFTFKIVMSKCGNSFNVVVAGSVGADKSSFIGALGSGSSEESSFSNYYGLGFCKPVVNISFYESNSHSGDIPDKIDAYVVLYDVTSSESIKYALNYISQRRTVLSI
jgi:hypothetical protein